MTDAAAKGEVCTGPCDHDQHERRGATWYGWYKPRSATRKGSETPASDSLDRQLRWAAAFVVLICVAAFVSFIIQGVMSL